MATVLRVSGGGDDAQESEESASHVGIHETEVLANEVLELAQTALKENKKTGEGTTINQSHENTTCSKPS